MILGIPDDFELETDSDTYFSVTEEPVTEIIRIDSFQFDKLSQTCNNDINYLTNKFQDVLHVQANEVQKLINAERERIRKQQEHERKAREEMERKQREEQLRLKQLEEQREKEAKEKRAKEEKEAKEKEQQKAREQEQKTLEEEKKRAQQAKEKEEKERLEKQNKLKQEAQKSQGSEALFVKYTQHIKEFKRDIVEKVNNDKAFKKAVGPVRRTINPKFGQLSNSTRQLNDITQGIISSVQMVTQNELAFKFILNFIAKAIVSQAEAEVIVQPHAAVPLGKLAASLLKVFPDLHLYLMARLVKKCPLIIGYSCSVDTEEGRLRMGWRRSKSTQKWEEQDKYDERVAGICSLFAVLTRLGTPQFPISMSWTFLARMGNLDPKLVTNVHFFCIANWWEACGQFFLGTYKSQGMKLLTVLAFDLTDGRKEPAAMRLKLLRDEGTPIKTFKPMDP